MGVPPVAGILLAAGASRRLGGPNKLLVEVDGRPLVRRTAEILSAAGIGPLFVVTGPAAGDVAAALAGLDVRLVHNEEAAAGMGLSLARGAAAVLADPGAAVGVAISVADLPWLGIGGVRPTLAAFHENGARLAVLPEQDGVPGHPVVVPLDLMRQLTTLTGDRGARALLARDPERRCIVKIDDPGIHRDLDTREALAALGKYPPNTSQ